MTTAELLRELAEAGTLLHVSSLGLLYVTAPLSTASCPRCGGCRAFYHVRQVVGPRASWSAICLQCYRREMEGAPGSGPREESEGEHGRQAGAQGP